MHFLHKFFQYSVLNCFGVLGTYLLGVLCHRRLRGACHVVPHPHNSNPNPANAAALLKQELAATSAAGACDFDSNGSEATAE